jgi:hypothetical protein
MKREKYYPPEHVKGQFHCPHCSVYAKQFWANIEDSKNRSNNWNHALTSLAQFDQSLDHDWTISACQHCGNLMIWLGSEIIYPKKMVVELPNEDLSDDIKKDYLEAAIIFN